MGSFQIIAAVGGVLMIAAPVRAADVVTGAFGAGDSVYRDGGVSLAPGRYRFTLQVTGGGGSVDGSVTDTRVSSYYCDFGDGAGEVYCGGDDVPIEPLLEPVAPGLYQAALTVAPPATYLLPGPTVRIEDMDLCCTYRFGFDASGAGSFAFSYAALPEPATWLAMIVGFAGLGATLRLRRASLAVS